MFALFLWACSTTTPAPAGDPEPQGHEDPKVEAKSEPVEAEPPVDAETVMLVFGTQCEPFPEGTPDSLDAVKQKLADAGVSVRSVTEAAACKACNTCPKLAVEVVADPGTKAAIAAVFPDNPAMAE
ncbi:MAG: hypothetical protein R3F61_14725 [Myxococcota bacterium]